MLASGTEQQGERDLRARARAIAEHRESRHAFKYAVVGVANTLIDFLIYAALVQLGLWYVAAKLISVAVANINGYTFNRIWTFRAGRYQHVTLIRYLTVQGTGLLLSLAIVTLLVEVVGTGEIIAGALGIPVVAVYCFALNRLWTFGRHIDAGADA